MSTPPPPYPGYPVQANVFPVDRRTARAQRKAAEAQARWQSDQVRLQRRALQRRSLAGPVLLVASGVLLLLLEGGRLHWSTVCQWLSIWWPAVLIGVGVLMLIEWGLDRQLSKSAGSVPPRRVLGGAAATFLVLLALVGASLTAARRSAGWMHENGWGNSDLWPQNLSDQWAHHGAGDWTHLFGAHTEFTNDLQGTLAPTGELTVEVPRGDVVVTGASEDGQVHVSVHQHLFSWNNDDLDRVRQREQPRFTGSREHLVLTSSAQGQDDADVTIQLPHEASVVVHSGHGDVSVEEVHGSATILARNGDVKLTAVRGPVKLSTSDDDATITAHSLGGGLTIDGRSGDIDLSDIQGGLVLHGDFFGTTQLERIRGEVNFQSSFTRVNCAGIPGSMTIEGRSDMTGQHIVGPLTIATTDRNLSLDGVRGASNITNRNGSVALTLAGPLQPVHVDNVNGIVEVSVPEHQAFTLHAQTHNAAIQDDFGLLASQTGETASVNGTVSGGGPVVDIQTTEDDIRVHKAAQTSDAAWDSGTPALDLGSTTKRPKESRHTTQTTSHP